MAHPIEGIMGISMDKIREMVDVNTIIGTPIVSEGTTIIPVSKVSFGFASGGSDLPTQAAEKFAGGSGAGVTVKPVAFIVIKADGDVELLELGNSKSSPLEGAIDAIPGLIEKIKGMAADKKAAKESKKTDKSEENDKDKKAEIGGE
ncbi:MAG: GerW family sporulation protein [Oscillospiraceae bacterium]|nr:GerW family sporulation protein [Oscillospiraceae bacterium]